MFSIREYIKIGYLDAVGKMPDYWVILNSMGYMEKGILLPEDLAEINAKIKEKNTPKEVTDIDVGEQEEELVEEE